MSLLARVQASGILYRFDRLDALSGWTEDSRQSSTAEIIDGYLHCQQPPNVSIDVGSVYHPLPFGSGPQVITACFMDWVLASSYMDIGVMLMSGDPATNDFYIGGPGVENGSKRAGVSLFSDYSSHTSRPAGTATLGASQEPPIYIRASIAANGTGWAYELSTDGEAWTAISSAASSSWTFTHFGLGGWSWQSGGPGAAFAVPWVHVSRLAV